MGEKINNSMIKLKKLEKEISELIEVAAMAIGNLVIDVAKKSNPEPVDYTLSKKYFDVMRMCDEEFISIMNGFDAEVADKIIQATYSYIKNASQNMHYVLKINS